MAKKIIVTIDKNGFVNAEINGVKGKKCLDYISLLEDILEGEVVSEEYTQEYYEQQIDIETKQNIKSGLNNE